MAFVMMALFAGLPELAENKQPSYLCAS